MTSGPSGLFVAVTPHDSTDVSPAQAGGFRGLYVGVGGNVAVVPVGGTASVTFTGVVAGTIIPVMGRRVNSTNTTATNIVALF